MSKEGYLSYRITPSRRAILDDAAHMMGGERRTIVDAEVIDFALEWLLVTAEKVRVRKLNSVALRRAVKQSLTNAQVHDENGPTHLRAKELVAATHRNKGRGGARR